MRSSNNTTSGYSSGKGSGSKNVLKDQGKTNTFSQQNRTAPKGEPTPGGSKSVMNAKGMAKQPYAAMHPQRERAGGKVKNNLMSSYI